MSKSLRESMLELDAAVSDLKAELWAHRHGLAAYLGGIWLIFALVAFAVHG